MSTVALYISSLHRGGSERVMSNIASFLAEKGHRVILVTQYRYPDEYTVDGRVKRIILENTENGSGLFSRLAGFVRRIAGLRTVWKREKPDVILSFIGKNNIMAVISSLGLGIPAAVSVRSDPAAEYDSAGLRKAAFSAFRRAAAVIVMTNRCKEFFPPYLQSKLRVLPNPISEEFLTDTADPAAGGRPRRIAAVGRVDENKHHRRMIDAFSAIADEFPDTVLTIYGSGELLEPLREYAASLPAADRIFLPGQTADIKGSISGASLFLLCSDFEGIPNALLEAMALGIPSIATDCPCGGPADIIEDGINGLLIPVGDEKALTEAMRKVLGNKELSDRLSEEAQKVRERFEPSLILSMWEKTLMDLAAGRKHPEKSRL